MSNGVRISIHHQEGIFPTRDHQMLGVIAGTPRCCQEIAVARLLLEILHPPRSPQRFYLLLWKFIVGHAYRPLRLKSRAAKSSRHFVCCAIPAEVANGWHR